METIIQLYEEILRQENNYSIEEFEKFRKNFYYKIHNILIIDLKLPNTSSLFIDNNEYISFYAYQLDKKLLHNESVNNLYETILNYLDNKLEKKLCYRIFYGYFIYNDKFTKKDLSELEINTKFYDCALYKKYDYIFELLEKTIFDTMIMIIQNKTYYKFTKNDEITKIINPYLPKCTDKEIIEIKESIDNIYTRLYIILSEINKYIKDKKILTNIVHYILIRYIY